MEIINGIDQDDVGGTTTDTVLRDGSLALTSDWDIGDTRKILTDEIRARDAAGLKLYDDGGNGIFVEDGGNVGIGITPPTMGKLQVAGGVYSDNFRTDEITTHNVFVGDNSGGSGTYSTLIGEYAGGSSSGANSNAIGYSALQYNSGASSNANGHSALKYNSGAYSNAIGSSALKSNTGVSSNAVGHAALQSNTGINSNAVGHSALQSNAGANSNAIGYSALQSNAGADSSAIGHSALKYNAGASSNAIGHYALSRNTGANSNAVGNAALQYNDGEHNTAIGDDAFNTWTADTANAMNITTTDIDPANNQVTVTGHGYSVAVNLIASTSGTLPAGLNTAVHQWSVIDGNTLKCKSDSFTNVGAGVLTLTPSVTYTNSGAFGYNAEPDASNQIVLGDANVTQVKTSGSIYSGGLDVNSDIIRLRTAKTPATAGADGNQGDIAWDANYFYVCTATNTWKRSGLSTW